MKKKLFIILGTLVLSINLVLSFALKDNKEENKEISKALEILSKPEGIQAYTLNGEKTNKEFSDLINNYVLDKITCKNGTVATYNKATNEVSLSNIHMPDYCTMNFRYTIYSKLLADNPTIKTRTDFSTVYTETNINTLFKSTESIAGSTAKDVYYFAGNAQNNWIKFAGFYWRIIRTNHDGSIRMLYSGISTSDTNPFIGSSAFNLTANDPMYAGYMYGTSGTLASNRTNENDSTIKVAIDTWYSNNLSSYTKYLSKEAVYCNDREIGNSYTYSIGELFRYASYYRTAELRSPSYNCNNISDALSGSNAKANLKYPIALMTADEAIFAGELFGTNEANIWYYLNDEGKSFFGKIFWLLSPGGWENEHNEDEPNIVLNAVIGRSDATSVGARRNHWYSRDPHDIRPVISLKGDLIWKRGDGSPENPYEIVYN